MVKFMGNDRPQLIELVEMQQTKSNPTLVLEAAVKSIYGGTRLMTVPIVYVFSTQGMLVWLVIALFLSVLASALPARGAVRLTIRDVLAYE